MVHSVWSLLAAASLAGAISGCVELLPYHLETPVPVKPDFERETGRSLMKGDPIAAVICSISPGIDAEHADIQTQLQTLLCDALAEHGILMTTPTVIQRWIEQHSGDDDPSEIGRFFECDYVIEIEIAEFGLFEENSVEFLRGHTEAYVSVHEMLPDGSGDCIYETEIDFAFPTRVPQSTSDTSYSQFKREYLAALSDKLSWLFVPRETGAQIHWAT
jgi:hypothetical protein